MAPIKIGLCLVMMMVVSSNAFLTRRTRTVTATEDPSEECISLGQQGSCEFYSCFERRLPCGPSWYIIGQGFYFCNKARLARANFTAEGQSFLDDSQRCMTSALVEAYQQDSVECHQLKDQAVATISTCSIDNAFCSVFPNNIQQFMNIYEARDLLSRRSMQIWGQIANLISRCGSEGMRALTQSLQASFSNMAQNIGNRFRNLFNRD